jgi:hypothetical protein
METAISTISIFPSNKLELEQYKRKLKSEILVNDRDPLAILLQLKFVEKTIADILTDKELDDHFITEAEKYKEKTFEHLGAKFTIAETGVKTEYSESGDSKWFDLQRQLTDLKKKIKERETFLASLPYEGTVDPETGLFLTKPPKKSKTKVTVTI